MANIKIIGFDAASLKVPTASDNLVLQSDSSQLWLGADTNGDLKLYHDGTDSYITNSTGELKISSSTVTLGATNGNQLFNIASHDEVDGGLQLAGTLVTASAAELNKLDGVTSTTAELNYLDITTLGTAAASKALVADSNAEIDASAITFTNLGTVTTVDINGGTLDGVTIGGASAGAGTFTTLDCNDGAFAIANLDIDGGTDIGAALVDADLLIVDDGAGGTNRKTALSRVKTYIETSTLTLTAANTFENATGQTFQGDEGNAGTIYLKADQGDDAGDSWKLSVADGGVLTAGNDIAVKGTYVSHLTLTPNATASSSTAAFAGHVTVGGDLTVNGTTTTVNSTVTTLDDPILTLGGDTAPSSDDNKDRGIEFRYYDSEARIGFMGWDDSAAGFTLLSAATNTSEVFSGTAADLVIGGLTTTGITLGGTAISSTADELNLMDGGSTIGTTAVADGHGLVMNHGGTMAQTTVQTLAAYLDDEITAMPNLVETGALNAGSITSGFGAINNGSSDITTSGTVTFGSLSDSTITITAFVDEDDMTSDSATLIPTQQSVKAYVDAQVGSGSSSATAGNVVNSGSVNVTANSDNSGTTDQINLKVGSSNTVVEVKSDRVEVAQPIILTKAGVSLAPASTHPAFSVGHVLSFEAGASGGLELADCDDTTSYLDAPLGIALEASSENNTNSIMVHTVHGGIANVKITSSTVAKGQWIYLSATAGTATTTAPTSGMVWRLGLSTEHQASAVTDVDIIWMPQFIADLG